MRKACLIALLSFAWISQAWAGCPGQIIAVQTAQSIDVEALSQTIKSHGRALIGERHGIREHPQTLACLLDILARKPEAEATPHAIPSISVAMEQLSGDQQEIITSYRQTHPEVADGLGVALRWWETGWPAWPVYLPLFQAVWRSRSALVAADVVSDHTLEDFDGAGLRFPQAHTLWQQAMNLAHCGLIEPERAALLAHYQMGRDQVMARSLSHQTQDIALLYAGRAHVRLDRSIPLWLDQPPLSIALWEVEDGKGPTDQAQVIDAAKGRYDYIWFVGTTSKIPACERLRAKGLIPPAPEPEGEP